MVKKLTINDKLLLIVAELVKGRAHIRKIAQNTGMNHVTVLNNMRILERQKLVSFMFVGRNKEYALVKSGLARSYAKMAEQYGRMIR